ncbi:protein of unknown function (DUF1844) [Cyclonatronum proteinivorum]|uniref:DUF1844 domain-containing protein n=1 Tax=Cyclonatronum proteinivorum TaxID=1457365 RepID=A0A345UHT2_9BACT|nr:DUF1844 domain-containing protein [Cyclonatronum proteinivorum]AXJ00034.1 protein of unknown function (DUF1844) [Cyclonatronum proteinivorum]
MELPLKELPEEKKQMLLFMMLLQQYEKIALMNLGEIPNPVHNQKEVDLKAARFATDTINMLRSYTAGNLNEDTAAYLESLYSKVNGKLQELLRQEAQQKKDDAEPESANGTAGNV